MRGELGGGTLAAKVAGSIEQNRAAQESNEASEAIAPEKTADDYDTQNYSTDAGASASAFDDDGPAWPSEAEESAFINQQAAAGEPANGAKREDEEELDSDTASGAKKAELPSMESLVARIPEGTRALLDELFRARFMKVKKFPKKYLSQ